MDPELLSSSDSSDDDDVILDTRYNIESVELSSDDDTDTDSDSDQEQQQQQPQQQTDLGLETTTSQSSVITSANSTSTHSGLNTDHSSGSDTSNSSTSNTNTNTNNTVNVSILRGGVAVTDLKRMNSTGTDSSGDEEIGEYNKQRIVGTDSLSSRSDSRTGKDGKSVLTDLFSPEISVEASNNDSNPEMSLQQEKQDTQDTSETPENQAANPLSVSTERFTTINSMESPGSPRSQATPTGRSTPQSPSINTTNVLSIPSPTQGNAEQTSTSSSTNLLSSPRRNSEMLQSPRGNKSPLTQRRSSNSESSSGSASVGSSTPLSPSLVEKGLLGETLGGQNDSRARGKSWAVQGMRTKSNIGPSARGSLNREETMTEDHDDIDEYDIQSMTNVLASLVDGGDIDHLDIDLDCVEETVQTLPLRVKTADELVDILDPSIESLSAFNNVDTENTITTAELHDEPAKFHLSELTQTVLSEGFDKMPFEIQLHVFKFLDNDCLASTVSKVCKTWNVLYQDISLWSVIRLRSAWFKVDEQYLNNFAVMHGGPHVEKLVLKYCIGVTNGPLINVVTMCPRITHLNLGFCTRINDDFFKSLSTLEACEHIERLTLNKCVGLTDVGVRYIAQSMPSLDLLNLYGCTSVSNQAIAELSADDSKTKGTLRCLSLQLCNGDTQPGFKFGEGDGITDDAMEYCNRLPKLASLVLSGIKRITNRSILSLAEVHRIPEDVRMSNQSDEWDDVLCHTRLRFIDVRGCRDVDQKTLKMFATECPHVSIRTFLTIE